MWYRLEATDFYSRNAARKALQASEMVEKKWGTEPLRACIQVLAV